MPRSIRAGTTVLRSAVIVAIALMAIPVSRALAGSLDPPAPPASTMRSLNQLLPAWDQKLTAAGADACNTPRFQCVLTDASHPTGAAVLDHETGLVWERIPSAATRTWFQALDYCAATSATGGRYGWRTPAIDELASLLFADNPGPFDVGTLPTFWTTTSEQNTSGYRRVVFFSFGAVGGGNPVNAVARVWCVRGGTGHDPQ